MTMASCAVRIEAHVRGHAQCIRQWKDTVTSGPQITTQTPGLRNDARIDKKQVGAQIMMCGEWNGGYSGH
jgi:hypothetical protein